MRTTRRAWLESNYVSTVADAGSTPAAETIADSPSGDGAELIPRNVTGSIPVSAILRF